MDWRKLLPRPGTIHNLFLLERRMGLWQARDKHLLVARGELRAFLKAVQLTHGHLVSVADGFGVASGWYDSKWKTLDGPDADLWAMINDEMQSGRAAVDQQMFPELLIVGNAAADQIAETAAEDAIIPA
eukprot:5851124-Pyramimonas_sp.AAC.1